MAIPNGRSSGGGAPKGPLTLAGAGSPETIVGSLDVGPSTAVLSAIPMAAALTREGAPLPDTLRKLQDHLRKFRPKYQDVQAGYVSLTALITNIRGFGKYTVPGLPGQAPLELKIVRTRKNFFLISSVAPETLYDQSPALLDIDLKQKVILEGEEGKILYLIHISLDDMKKIAGSRAAAPAPRAAFPSPFVSVEDVQRRLGVAEAVPQPASDLRAVAQLEPPAAQAPPAPQALAPDVVVQDTLRPEDPSNEKMETLKRKLDQVEVTYGPPYAALELGKFISDIEMVTVMWDAAERIYYSILTKSMDAYRLYVAIDPASVDLSTVDGGYQWGLAYKGEECLLYKEKEAAQEDRVLHILAG